MLYISPAAGVCVLLAFTLVQVRHACLSTAICCQPNFNPPGACRARKEFWVCIFARRTAWVCLESLLSWLMLGCKQCMWQWRTESRNVTCYTVIMPRAEALSDDGRLTSVCLSRTSGLSQEQIERLRKTKIGTEPCTWLRYHFQSQKVKGQLAGAGAYCGGLAHGLFLTVFSWINDHIVLC